MSFDFEVINKTGVDLEADPMLERVMHLYIDFYNYAHNKIVWQDANKALKETREFLESRGLVINATDHALGEQRE